MGAIPVPALVLILIIVLLLLLSSKTGDGRHSNGGKGKGGRGHGGNGQPDDPDAPQGKGNGKGSGHKASGKKPGSSGRRHNPHHPQGGASGGYTPPPVLPSFNSPADREAYCRDLERQGCTVNRSTGQVTRPGEAPPQSPFMNSLMLLGALGFSLLLYIRIYGSPLLVIYEFVRIMSEHN